MGGEHKPRQPTEVKSKSRVAVSEVGARSAGRRARCSRLTRRTGSGKARLASPSPGGLAEEEERAVPPPVRGFFVAGVVSDCSGGLAEEAAYSFSVAPGGRAEDAASLVAITPGGLAEDAASEVGNTPLAALQIRVFLAAGAVAAATAAVVVIVVLRALVGGPSLACLAALFELAAV